MPKLPKFAYLAAGLIAGVTLSIGGAYALTHSSIDVFAQEPDTVVQNTVVQPDAPLAFSQVFSYQARLLTPGSGDVKPDGVYQITFSIYKVVTGGSALWTETKSVTVANGAFTSLIGDSTPLPLNIFTGQELYLGIKVGDDAEATPRQRLAHAAYAMWAESAGTANTANSATSATNATNATNAVNATNATNANHATVADNATNADNAASADNATNATNAQLLDDLDSTAFAAAGHNHDDRYYTESEADSNFINAAGPDGMTGSSTDPILKVTQSGTGNAVEGTTNSTDFGKAGVYGTTSSVDGVDLPASAAGVLGRSSDQFGVVGMSDTNEGVYGRSKSAYGVRAESSGAQAGLLALADGTSATSYGVYAISGNSHGVYADGAEYGFYTDDKIFAGAGYFDLAEHMPAADDVEAGDVVVVDPTHDERVIKSFKANDPAVAGVISTDPAMLLGDAESKSPLALAGRTPVKVSAENGPIHRGDLLTTSATPGRAMRATPVVVNGVEFYAPGTIIGKAMGELAEGTGVIVVLILPQ